MRNTATSLAGRLFIFAGLVFGLTSFAFGAETIRIRADMWMPYNGDPTSENPGYVVELARKIFEPHGIKVNYEIMPWAEALESARSGKIDGVIGAGSAELEGLTVPAESIGEPRVVLLVKKDSTWKFENVTSLKNIKLGAIEGYTYWEALDEYIKAGKEPAVRRFGGETPLVDALNQLTSGKIDVMPETMAVFVWTVKGMGMKPSDFHIAYTWQNEPIYLAFSKTPRGVTYAKMFDEGVKKLRASGEFAALLKRYGLTEWK
ncbi:MAG: transporter substrate-binding domain-containing protein [Nibricoccus sp.]